jgi:predicted nucleic acid-binding protein
MAISEELILVTSQLVLIETRRNLSESASDKLQFLENALANIPFELTRPTKREVLAAAKRVVLKDAPIIAAARKAKVGMLVTLDKKHLLGKPDLAAYLGVPIVTPKEAILALL